MEGQVDLSMKRWSDEQFQAVRQEVLDTWRTGQEVRLDEAIAYLRMLPPHQNQAWVLKQALTEGRTVMQPSSLSDLPRKQAARAGIALIDEWIKVLLEVQNDGQADALPTNLDTYTRENNYQMAELGIEESRREGSNMINGFPVANYGIQGCRRVREAVDRPLVVRSGAADSRLVMEIAWASGFSDVPCGGIIMPTSHHKNVALADSIRNWQYVARLGAWYTEHGWPINHEVYGGLSGTLIPPSICLSYIIIDSLIQAAQGIKFVSPGYAATGNLIQDVAGVRVLKRLADEYMARFDFADVTVSTTFYQWTGAFPHDPARSYALICWNSMAAVLGGATQVIVKSAQEATGLPTAQANAQALRATKAVITMLCNQKFPDSPELAEEMHYIEIETRAIVNRVIELGDGDVVVGAAKAFESGVLDCPFSCWLPIANKVMPARDAKGAIRFLDHGNLPLPAEAVKFHQSQLEIRSRLSGKPLDFDLTVADVVAVSEGRLIGR